MMTFKILALLLLVLPTVHCFQTQTTQQTVEEAQPLVVPIELQIECTGLSMKDKLTSVEKWVVSETLEKTYVTRTGNSSTYKNNSHHNCMPLSIQGIHDYNDEYLKVYGHRHCCLIPCDADEE